MIFLPNFRKRLTSKIYKILFERFEYRYFEIPDQIVELKTDIIPNIVYQTWVSKKLPWRLIKGIKEFRKLNKNHTFLIYSHSERDEYMKNNWGHRKIFDIYQNASFQACKADIWRYCILYDKGGYYFDIKSACLTPLSDLLISEGAVLTYEKNFSPILPSKEILNLNCYRLNMIANWAFGFKKKHPLLELIISNIEKDAFYFEGKIFTNPKSAIISFTGPGMLTKSYNDYLQIFKKEISFNGVDFNEKGIYSLSGAEYRFKMCVEYGKIINEKILN